MTRRTAIRLGGGLVAAGLVQRAATAKAGEPGARPVVVELFTSQGCSSCPPADRFLLTLAVRPDVLALAYHVDYWDYIGWKDPFASPMATERQRDYVRRLGLSTLYTPQMVVDGRFDVVGSQATRVEQEIRRAAAERPPGPALAVQRGAIVVGEAASPPGGGGRVLAVTYRLRAETDVARGENAGRRLIEGNIVTAVAALGRWTGGSITLPMPPTAPTGSEQAILVEGPRGILAASRLTPTV